MKDRLRKLRGDAICIQERARSRLSDVGAVAFLGRVARRTAADGAGDMAAAFAYYAVLSLFPLLLAVIAFLGLFLPETAVVSGIFEIFQRYLPGTTVDVVRQNVEAVIRVRGELGAASLIALFWSGSLTFGALGRFINMAWGISKLRPFHIRKLRDLSLAFGTVVLFFASLAATGLAVALSRVELPALAWLAGRSLGFSIVLAFFLLAYKYMPNTRVHWRDAWTGALIASVLFEIWRSLFELYLRTIADFSAVYGPLASVVVFLAWVYVSAFIVILGAEFGSESARTSGDKMNSKRRPVP
ncbi:MAG: YihY/virulence factor BrkB family protein [Chloroflexi bacterium]|nr:YihY/virulence factor BrkB family protein [Chloroflexota bacterium]